jgi:hypothetical protein
LRNSIAELTQRLRREQIHPAVVEHDLVVPHGEARHR